MQIVNQVKMELMSSSENVGIARIAAATFAAQADFTLSAIEEIKVAVSEAVSNAIIHGYGNSLGVVTLLMTMYDDRIEFTVADQGKGIADVQLARQPSYSTDPERMGLGFVFMESFMDGLEVSSELEQGTTIKMMKNVAPRSNPQ